MMRHYNRTFDTNQLILFLMYFEPIVQCFMVTPRTVPDDIQLFNCSHVHGKDYDIDRGKHNKPWLIYVDANLKKSLSDCFSRRMKSTEFSQMWQCTFNFSPSYQMMNHKMKNVCPASNKSKVIWLIPLDIIAKEKELADIKPDKVIVGRIILSTTRCPKFIYLQLSAKIPKLTVTITTSFKLILY